MDVAWVQGVMVVVGATTESADSNPRVVLMMYDPSSDTWESAPAFPGSKKTPGAIVYTAESVLLVGGDHFYEDDTAWEFDLVDRQWRQLPDPGLEPVESMAGVWTGTEAIFYGGTIGGTGPSPARAFDPVQRSWRDLEPPDELMEYPKLLWTGREVLVVPEFPSAGDRRGLRYDPRSGTWSELANIPVDYVQRRSVGWNGARVFTWGVSGVDEASTDDGALYDPTTNRWTPVPNPPHAGRCEHTITWAVDRFLVVGGMTPCLFRRSEPVQPVPILSFLPTSGEWETLHPVLGE